MGKFDDNFKENMYNHTNAMFLPLLNQSFWVLFLKDELMFPPFQRSGIAVFACLLWKYIFRPADASRVRRFPPTITGLQQ